MLLQSSVSTSGARSRGRKIELEQQQARSDAPAAAAVYAAVVAIVASNCTLCARLHEGAASIWR
jgi:adenylate kinase